MAVMKLFAALILLFASSLSAQVTCSWFNSPAYEGVIPAFSTPGLQDVSYSTANVQWQCSGLTSGAPAGFFRVKYGTTTSYSSVYNFAPASVPGTVSDNRPVGGPLGGLLASTTYHAQGQSCVGGSDGLCTGGTWYSTPDLTFTTTAAPTGAVSPLIPALPINLSPPAMTGTHWLLGTTTLSGYVNCPSQTAGNTSAIATANLQACLNAAQPGDDIGAIPQALGGPAAYPINQVFFPDQGIHITCAASGTTCTVGSSSNLPATNSQVVVFPGGGLNPINQSYPYYVVGASGTTFSLAATLGGSAITFSTASTGSTEFLPYPYPLSKSITIHSTASAANLPPPGTKLACSSLAQYSQYMPIFEIEDPTAQYTGGGTFVFNAMSSGYYTTNVGFTVDTSIGSGSAVDPPGIGNLLGPGYGVAGNTWTNENIAYNQIFIQVPLPLRSQSLALDGVNVNITNSCIDGLNWWEPTYYSSTNSTPSSTGQTYNQNSVVWSWPGTAGAKQTVTSPVGSFSITGGTASGNVTTWVNPADGTNHAQIPSGLTYTSSGITVHQYAAPTVTPNTTGSTSHTYACLPTGTNVQVGISDVVTLTNSNATTNNTITCGAVSGATNYWILRDGSIIGSNASGTLTDTGQFLYGATTATIFTPTSVYYSTATGVPYVILSSTGLNVGQWSITSGTLGSFSSGAIYYGGGYFRNMGGQAINGGAGYGPTALINNDIMDGNNIVGYFGADGFIEYTSCSTPCVNIYTPGQVTLQRNHIKANPLANQFNPSWDGQWVDGRNQPEKKIGHDWLVDGNVFEGVVSSAGTGQCFLNYYISSDPPWLGVANTMDYSNFSFTNNTCLDLGAGVVIGANNNSHGDQTVMPAPTAKNILIKNNLILNTPGGYGGWKTANLYAPPGITHYAYQNSTAGCPNSYSFVIGTLSEGTRLEHNTVRNANGCFPYSVWFAYQPFSGTVLNNLFEWTSDAAGGYNLTMPTIYQNVAGDNNDTPNCLNNTVVAMIANGCAPQMKWSGNLFLPTYADTFPGTGNQEFTSAQITTGISSVPSGLWATYGNGTTGAARLSWVGFYNTNSKVSGGYSLTSSSPGISGAQVTTDGTDVGIDADALAVAQGQISNAHAFATSSTSGTVVLYAPDSFACSVDWGTTPFFSGTGTWTRVAGAAGSPDPRAQSVPLTGLPAHGLIYYRINGAVQQPTGTLQLP